jgi:uncharacterized protein
MKKEFAADRLDVKAFAQAGATLSGQDALQDYARLAGEVHGPQAGLTVNWSARGEARSQAGGSDQLWLHLQAHVSLPLICQRCMGPVTVDVVVDRSFRFVADEIMAAELVEDELLMAMPLVPRHDSCPTEVKLAVADAGFEAESTAKANPFAALAGLRVDKSS